jgi:hypothetical protein
MAARDFNTEISNIGDAIGRMYGIAAIAQGARSLLDNEKILDDEDEKTEADVSVILMLERIEDDIRRLAGELSSYDLRNREPV